MAVKHSTASDVTFSGSGATAWDASHTVDDNTLVAAKLSAAATSRFFGRITSGAGAGEELTAANAKTILAYTLASSDFVNQGTTTTVLHGNAAGNPAFSAVLEADITLADNTTNDVSTARHGLVPKAPNDTTKFLRGDATWAAPSASVTLNGIAAATASATIASGNNTGIIWNWANTADTTVAFTFGETTAATSGTSTSGVPNQVLLKIATLASSTQSPLSVYSRGTHVFSVSPTAAQILGGNGTAGAPTYSFATATATGFYTVATNQLRAVSGGTDLFCIGVGNTNSVSVNGNVTYPSTVLGTFYVFSDGTQNGGIDIAMHRGKSTTTAPVFSSYKARGSVSAPTVITTGDDLAKFSGYGYVGATNTYQEAARITFTSTGTISDSATGIGGIITFSHATVGAEPVAVATIKSQHVIHSGTAPTITANGGTNPTIAGTDEAFVVTIGTGGTATSVEVTFGNAFTTNPPVCTAASDTDIVPFKVVATTTKVTITAALAFTAGSKIDCICRGWE